MLKIWYVLVYFSKDGNFFKINVVKEIWLTKIIEIPDPADLKV